MCSKEFMYDEENGHRVHCSKQCQKEQKYKTYRNPFSPNSNGLRKKYVGIKGKDLSCCPGAIIDNVPGDIRYLISNLPSRPYIIEDIEEINRAISEELPIAKVKGKPRKRATMEERSERRARQWWLNKEGGFLY